MSFIAGYFSFDKEMDHEFAQKKLNEFSVFPDDRPADYESIFVEGKQGCLMGRFKPEAPRQVYHTQTATCTILTLGFQFFAEGEDIACSSGGQAGPIEGIIKKTKESEGEFVSLIMDHHIGDIHVINDRFSARPFFILADKGGYWFSTNYAFLFHLAGASPSPDPLGWLEVFSYAHTLLKQTTSQDIKRLLPASHGVFSGKGYQESRYWQIRYAIQDHRDPEAFAAEVFGEFKKSVARRVGLSTRGFIALSGGLDSRMIAGAMPAASDYFAFTTVDSVGSEQTPEVMAAREVARKLGMDHHLCKLKATQLSDNCDTLVQLTGGLIPVSHTCKSLEYIKEMVKFNGFMVGGGPGDCLAGSYATSIRYLQTSRTDAVVKQFCRLRKLFDKNVLKMIFRDEIIGDYYPQLDRAMFECFETINGPSAVHKITAWSMQCRQPCFTFTSPIHTHPDVTEASPHLGYAYNDLLLTLPMSWIFRKNFYDYMVYQCMPELRDIIYANTGQCLSGEMQTYAVSLRKKITGIIDTRLPSALVLRRNTWRQQRIRQSSFVYDLFRQDDKLYDELRAILYSVSGLKQLFKLDGCEKFIADFQAGNLHTPSPAREVELMGSLATALYWFKYADSIE
ncbi:MAG: hypothetical protein K9M57_02070 [Phycisphaerae bacterium]|nr:hypothetical protein [Phycisphaerae bacterium]